MSLQSLWGSHWCLQQLVVRGSLYLLADSVTVSLGAAAEAAVAVEAALEAEFEAEVEAAFEAFASLREAAWERTQPFRVSAGCLRDEAWEAGL